MAEIQSVDLRGKIPDVGPVHFLRAEWQVPQSRFVILRYAVGDYQERPMGLRLDLDKRAILDDIEDQDQIISVAVKERAGQIWDLVIKYRRERQETYA